MQSGTTGSYLLNKQLTITGTSECITKWAQADPEAVARGTDAGCLGTEVPQRGPGA